VTTEAKTTEGVGQETGRKLRRSGWIWAATASGLAVAGASLGIANSRMKDFFDLWVLTRHSELEPTVQRRAITAIFARRGTALPTNTPVGLSDEFAGDGAKQIQWRAFTARNQLAAPELRVIVQHLRQFLETAKGRGLFPLLVALRQWGEDFFFEPDEAHVHLVDKKKGLPVRR
jgi:Nucleotidyl transferase AbiEii toxin, Type IV TA system